MSANPYEELLPYWRAFARAREYLRGDKDPDSDWLFTVGARERMEEAERAWTGAIDRIVPGARVEWPDDPLYMLGPFIEGPCIINGILYFS